MDVASVNAFETGTNTWRRLQSWPAGCTSGCNIKPTPSLSNRRNESYYDNPGRRQ